jgi:hypothetical protein
MLLFDLSVVHPLQQLAINFPVHSVLQQQTALSDISSRHAARCARRLTKAWIFGFQRAAAA